VAAGRPEKYTEEWLSEEAAALCKWASEPDNLWLKGFAYERGYQPQRLHEFAEKSKEFSLAMHHAKDQQEKKFILGALNKSMGMDFVKYFMPRMLKDRPEWKNSWDAAKEPSQADTSALIDYLLKQAKQSEIDQEKA